MTRDEVIRGYISHRTKTMKAVAGQFVIAASEKVVLLYVDGVLDNNVTRKAFDELKTLGLASLKRKWFVNGLIVYCGTEDAYQRVDQEDCSTLLVGRAQFRPAVVPA